MRGFAVADIWFVTDAIWRRRPIVLDDQSCALRHGGLFGDGSTDKFRAYLNLASGPLAFPMSKIVAWQSVLEEGLFSDCTVEFDRLDESNSIVKSYLYESSMKDLLPPNLAAAGDFLESDARYMCDNFAATRLGAVYMCRFVRAADEAARADIRRVDVEGKDAWAPVGHTTFSPDAVRHHGVVRSHGLVLRGDVAERVRSYWDDEYFIWQKLA